MKKNYILLLLLLVTTINYGQIFISEVDYDNSAGLFVVISGPNPTSLDGYSLQVFDKQGKVESTVPLTAANDIGETGISQITFTKSNGVQQMYFALVDGSSNVVDMVSAGDPTKLSGGDVLGVPAGDIDNVGVDTGDGDSLQLNDEGAWVADVVANGILSVDSNILEDFKVFPNPVTNGELYIATDGNSEVEVNVFTTLGSEVYGNSVMSNEVIDLSGLEKGIYILRVKKEGKIGTRKLIVQ